MKLPNKRKPTKKIKVGNLTLGGQEPIRVQAFCTTKTADVKATVEQIHELEEVGCEIVRVNVVTEEEANAVSHIKKEINIPLVADVLFNDGVILKAIRRGADKIRINPGKFELRNLERVVTEARSFNIPIRIGINSGALPDDILAKYGQTARGMVEAALQAIGRFEQHGFDNIVISLKSSNVIQNIEANSVFAEKSHYPIHLGITQGGTRVSGLVRSSIGVGYLLVNGIGDTFRFSLSEDPKMEVVAGHSLLRSLGLREGPIVVAGTSSRSDIDVTNIAWIVEKALSKVRTPLRVAVLGSPIEEDEMNISDIGVCGDKDEGVIFKNGEVIKRVKKDEIVDVLLEEIDKMVPLEE